MSIPEPHDDDFGAFAVAEGIFHGLFAPDVFRVIRRETEVGLRQQVSDSVLNRIETFGSPKSLSVVREIPGASSGRVTHFAFCVRARLFVSYAGGRNREVIDATLTFFFADMDLDDGPRYRADFDLHREAELGYADDRFKSRALAFIAERRRSNDRSTD